jgi:hypothetical protein
MEAKDREPEQGQGPVMIPKDCKRLAEVDFPIAEVSRHAAREKSIRHGHPSTLHLWWARRHAVPSRPAQPAVPPGTTGTRRPRRWGRRGRAPVQKNWLEAPRPHLGERAGVKGEVFGEMTTTRCHCERPTGAWQSHPYTSVMGLRQAQASDCFGRAAPSQ